MRRLCQWERKIVIYINH